MAGETGAEAYRERDMVQEQLNGILFNNDPVENHLNASRLSGVMVQMFALASNEADWGQATVLAASEKETSEQLREDFLTGSLRAKRLLDTLSDLCQAHREVTFALKMGHHNGSSMPELIAAKQQAREEAVLATQGVWRLWKSRVSMPDTLIKYDMLSVRKA